ncbi:hypothetical protein PFISCL1PPCAC_19066, partial [Pristionchus fissidentatus]
RLLPLLLCFASATAEMELNLTPLKNFYEENELPFYEGFFTAIFNEEANSIQKDPQEHFDYCMNEGKEFVLSGREVAAGEIAMTELKLNFEKWTATTFNSTDEVIDRVRKDAPNFYSIVRKRVNITNLLLAKTGQEAQQFVKDMASLILQVFVEYTVDLNDKNLTAKAKRMTKTTFESLPLTTQEALEDLFNTDKEDFCMARAFGLAMKKMKAAYGSLSETSRRDLEKILCLKSFGRLALKAAAPIISSLETIELYFEW